LETRLKRFTQHRISHQTARHAQRGASAHATQVLQATMDFGRSDVARLAMPIKGLKQRTFSLSSTRRDT
jgi:hypothetical protein